MASFLFWNVNKKDLSIEICRIAHTLDLDFLVLCEFTSDIAKLISGLNNYAGLPYSHITGIAEQRFHIFSRFRSDLVVIRHEQSRILVLRMAPPGITAFNFMILHAPSKASHWGEDSIDDFLLCSAQELIQIEKKERDDRSVVVGDFNGNPFTHGLVSARGFHAIMEAKECQKKSKVVLGVPYPYFYNPMWNFFGDQTKGPPGTYYYRGSSYIEQQWHMLDQVIVRPSMLNNFNVSSLDIVRQIDGQPLSNRRGHPCSNNFSDHFPLFFEINP